MIVASLDFIAMLIIIAIAICRLNAMQKGTALEFRVAYVILAVGAFSELFAGDKVSPSAVLLHFAIAVMLAVDRRKAECYHPMRRCDQ